MNSFGIHHPLLSPLLASLHVIKKSVFSSDKLQWP
jgi:hypothetical protein